MQKRANIHQNFIQKHATSAYKVAKIERCPTMVLKNVHDLESK